MTDQQQHDGLDLDPEHLSLSYVALMHPISDLVDAGKFKGGQFVVTPQEVPLAIDDVPGFEAQVLYLMIDRRYQEGRDTKCQGSKVGGVWLGNPGFGQDGYCDGCQYWQNPCQYRYNYFVRITKGWDENAETEPPEVVVATLWKGSGGQAGRRLNTLFVEHDGVVEEGARKIQPFRSIYRFSSTKKQRRGTAGEYWAWAVERVGEASPHLIDSGLEQFRLLKGSDNLLPAPRIGESEESDFDPAKL